MKFFADHCVQERICEGLEKAGHEVQRLKNHLIQDAKDPEVLGKAQELGAVLISVNGDFSQIVEYPPSQYGGIISLRERNQPNSVEPILEQLFKFLDGKNQQDIVGRLVIVETFGFRQRTTP